MAKDDDPVNPFGMRGRRPAPKRKASRRTQGRRPDVRPPPPVRPPAPATPVTPGPQVPGAPGPQVAPVPVPAVPPTPPPESVPESVEQESEPEISEEPPAAEPVTAEQTAGLEVELDVISDEPEIVETEEDGEEDGSEEQPPDPLAPHPDAVPELKIPQIKSETGGPPFRRRRQRVKTPSKRTTKLDRRRYMEYKVDMREILKEEDVPEEHRANVLGTTWARGERTGISDAEDYVNEKLAEGVLTDAAAQRILSVLRRYTTKR